MRSTRPKGALVALVAGVSLVVLACVPPPTYPTPPIVPVLMCDDYGIGNLYPQPGPTGLDGLGFPQPSPCTGEGVETLGQPGETHFDFTGDLFAKCDDPEAVPLQGEVRLAFGPTWPPTTELTAHLEMDPCYPMPGPAGAPEPGPSGVCKPEPSPGEPQPFIRGEVLCMAGTVTSDIYEGHDIAFTALVHPNPTMELDGNGTIDYPQPNPMQPTMDSYLTFQSLADVPEPHSMIWSTDGAAFATLDGNDDAILDGGFVVYPIPDPAG
ncbi:MAG TPA: hypothetical protein VJM33_07265 [Microthrixaceae bacterium]|nr:hypothetical protein [Microthrixaceae bacterium]